MPRKKAKISSGDPLWYKDAIFYQMRIASFADSDGDGIGDFRGAVEKMDYLKDLGVNVLWLLPFYPSPGRDDGYDTADYMNVRPEFGTMDDFKLFLDEAHRRDLKVMTELVINHTSDQHAWFQRARRAPKYSPEREFYVWSDTKDKYPEVRIIFQDFEPSNWTWDPVAEQFYWHRFFYHQPDLNFDNPLVHDAVFEALDFWFDMGVDGLRLDAIPYLYEREGTNGENLPETHEFLKKLRARVDQKYPNRVLLAEANQWPEDAVAYFGDGDECHMAFHFPIMPRLYLSLRTEERYPIIDILKQTPNIPENAQWAMFLRNHDELTLEMVTDEERDIMRRAYAPDKAMRINLGIRRRLAPLLNNDRNRMELMNGLLFSLPGTPIIYYGDEIGMGDNVYLGDRNGVRTPMQWSPDRNAGFSTTNPQRLFLPVITDPAYHYEAINVEVQQSNPHSLLWWMKRVMALRKRYKAFGRGTVEFLQPENSKILAFLRRYEDELILVVANLSRFTQSVDLDLSAFKGMSLVEMFGGSGFPDVKDAPYTLTMGPHNFFWFSLVPSAENAGANQDGSERASLQVPGDWQSVFDELSRDDLEDALQPYILPRRWFQSKARRLKRVAVEDVIPVGDTAGSLVITRASYDEGDDELYLLPMTFASGDEAANVLSQMPSTVIADVTCVSPDGAASCVLYDASVSATFGQALLEAIASGKTFKGKKGKLRASSTAGLKAAWDGESALTTSVYGFEQSNTSIRYGEDLFLKLVRKVAPGVNPELEIGRYLAASKADISVPKLLGALEYQRGSEEPYTLAVLQNFTPNQGDAWRYTLNWLGRFFENQLAQPIDEQVAPPAPPTEGLLELSRMPVPEAITALMGTYLADARLLGQRTAEMHVALATGKEDPAFNREPFTTLYQRGLYQSMYNLTNRIFRQLRSKRKTLSGDLAAQVDTVLGMEERILNAFKSITLHRMSGSLIRVHGDYHLGQVLHTGNDFILIDFEGEPGRGLAERRLKRSPLRDVAGMLRSFDYASYAALPGYGIQNVARIEDLPKLEPWSQLWRVWASAAFLGAYMETAKPSGILPNDADTEIMLRTLLLEKAVYEIGYELNNRPDWLKVPVAAVAERVAEWETA